MQLLVTRFFVLLLSAVALLSNGCSALIAQCGQDPWALETKEQVHARFGEPGEVGTMNGQVFEEYRTRRKIAEEQRAYSDGLGLIMTYGLGEVIALPCELCRLCHHTIMGQRLRFIYDGNNGVSNVYLDGEAVYPLSILTRPSVTPQR